MPLSAEDIGRALDALSQELAERDERAQIAVAGGAALVLLFKARQTTKDVDVFIIQPDPPRVREAAVEVARRLDLPEDWLNDGAKGYFTAISEGEVLYESASLLVRAVITEQTTGDETSRMARRDRPRRRSPVAFPAIRFSGRDLVESRTVRTARLR